MQVAVVRPNESAADPVDLCVVVDVVRATTTAAVLCHRLGELCVVRTPADLVHLPQRPGGYALFSELSGVEADLPRFDNSPVQARDADLAGRTPVLVTTNGTLAIGLAAQRAREVVLAGFVNMSAVVAHARWSGAGRVAIMPAGNLNKGERCAEDDGCAETLASWMSASDIDVPATIAACRNDARILRRLTKEPELGADLDICFAVDSVSVVPRIVGSAAERWFGVIADRRMSPVVS